MGKGSMKGSVKDYFKKRGQRTHGELGKRQRLSAESEKRRRQWKAERREESRKAEGQNPSYGYKGNK